MVGSATASSSAKRAAVSRDSPDAQDEQNNRKNANRACDFCHRMKMKCIGREDPPCERCKAAGNECTFIGPRKGKGIKVEDRIQAVEGQIGQMQSAIQELLTMQRMTMAGAGIALPPSSSNLVTSSAPAGLPQPTIKTSKVDHSFPSETYKDSSSDTDDDDDGEPDDPLTSNAAEPWDKMFSLAEVARLRKDGHDGSPTNITTSSTEQTQAFDHGDAAQGGSRKRRKIMGSIKEFKQSLPAVRTVHDPSFQDPIDLGYCGKQEAKELFEQFMTHSMAWMPCFDPDIDTFESLRQRSPFCIAAILFTSRKINDALTSTPRSETQRQLLELAEKMGTSSVFTPIAGIEVIQAIIVLASWGETSWRPGGHAMRIAMDMGLYRCLPLLVGKDGRDKESKGKSEETLRGEHRLVVGARVWLTLYKLELEMAFNLGRPALFAAEETIRHARDFLHHPLSIENDSRLVATCELLTVRLIMHKPFSLMPQAIVNPDFDAQLSMAEDTSQIWYEYWDSFYAKKGVPEGHFLREALLTGRACADLYSNARVLHSARNKSDVAALAPVRAARILKAVRGAERLIEMCLRSEQYKRGFRFGNSFAHVNMAFSARFLIRAANLMPDRVDSRAIGRDVAKVAEVLRDVPGFPFASQLQAVMQKARRHHVLPPPSKPSSPLPGISHLPALSSNEPSLTPLNACTFTLGLPETPSSNTGMFDFSYADSLFTGGAGENGFPQPLEQAPTSNMGDGMFAMQDLADPTGEWSFGMDNWFEFPPLDSDNNAFMGL